MIPVCACVTVLDDGFQPGRSSEACHCESACVSNDNDIHSQSAGHMTDRDGI